jgi:uncharacterized lipoprotein YajG
MTTTELSVFFKMQQKDDKKEVLKFEIRGQEDDGETTANDLYALAGSIILFDIDGCAAGETSAEFMNIQRDSKKTTMKFAIKGDSEKKAQELYKYAGRNVKIKVQPSQMTIEEFYEVDEHEGIEYSVDSNGNVKVPKDQMSMDEVEVEVEKEPVESAE